MRNQRSAPSLNQLNVAVTSMAATLAFYRRLGLRIEADAAGFHAAVELPNGLQLEFDTVEFVKQWNTGAASIAGGTTVLGFSLASREAVDERYADLTGAGHRGVQPPYDAFWGARYAVIADPDGNPVGLMSQIDEARRFWPPGVPPRA